MKPERTDVKSKLTQTGSLPLGEYVTFDEVAELLQVSKKTLCRWATKDPSLPVLRLGGKVGGTLRFPRERFLRWLRAREQGPGQARRSPEPLPHEGKPLETQEKSSNTHAP